MKRLLVAILMTGVFLAACARGGDAVKKMTADERAFLDSKLQRITAAMSEGDIVRLLGTPYRAFRFGDRAARIEWMGPHGDRWSRVLVYVMDERVYLIRWVKLGSFFWEKKLLDGDRGSDNALDLPVRPVTRAASDATRVPVRPAGHRGS